MRPGGKRRHAYPLMNPNNRSICTVQMNTVPVNPECRRNGEGVTLITLTVKVPAGSILFNSTLHTITLDATCKGGYAQITYLCYNAYISTEYKLHYLLKITCFTMSLNYGTKYTNCNCMRSNKNKKVSKKYT